MGYSILAVGRSMVVVRGDTAAIPPSYTVTRCNLILATLSQNLERVKPDAVLLCLNDETEQSLGIYRGLHDSGLLAGRNVILCGTAKDCRLFAGSVDLDYKGTLTRPFGETELLLVLGSLRKKPAAAKPAAKPPEKPSRGAAAQLAASLASRLEERRHILVVDDDPKMLKLIRSYLQEHYDVTIVPSGTLARDYLDQHRTDLILLDYMMNLENGDAVYLSLKKNAATRNIPVIFLTSMAEKDIVLDLLQLLPDDYLIKPVTKETLLTRVSDVLETREEGSGR